jgi:hypothetical protein
VVANAEPVKPKTTQPSQNFTLSRDSVWQNMVKCADTVSSDEEQTVAKVINITHFAVPHGNSWKRTLEKNG